MELNTSASTPAPLTGRELLPLSQSGVAYGALLAELGDLPRGAMLLRRVNYWADTAATADADPGAGNVRWNHATQASATELYIDDVDSDAADHGSLWATLSTGGALYLYDAADPTLWQQWSITAVTDAAGYLKLAVSLMGSNGSIADDAAIKLSLQQPDPAPGGGSGTTQAITSASTITPLVTDTIVQVSALAVGATIAAPSGTAALGQGFLLAIKDNGTTRALTWNAAYVGVDAALTATTTAGKWMYFPVTYNAAAAVWHVFKPAVQL